MFQGKKILDGPFGTAPGKEKRLNWRQTEEKKNKGVAKCKN